MSFTETQQKAIDQIEKLLNLAAKAGTPAEAAAAANKAQELLTKHNLSSESLEDSSAKQSAKREEAKVDGGRYAWQRELWRAVAELNFCHYWQRLRFRKREHCFIGRVVNTKMTIAMATYLENAIDRMANKRVGDEGWKLTSKWAFDYRRGAFEAVIDKLRKERKQIIDVENAKAVKAGMNSAAGTALTVAGFSKSEEDANYVFQHGEEALTAKKEHAAYLARAEKAYTVWAAKHPGEAAEKFRFKDIDGSEYAPFVSYRRRSTKYIETDWSAFKAGNEDGKKIGLDPQTETRNHKRIAGSKDIYL